MSGLSPDDQRVLGTAHLARLLLQALRRVERASVDKLHGRGHEAVRTGHIPVFANVDAEGTRITDLAARAGMTRQMMGRLVRELEEHGYASSRPDPGDHRAVIVSLTERGWAFCHDAQEVMAELEREYETLLGADLDRLRAALSRLAGS
jgi:DNA-binding MarR family transcriptional regulator